MPVSNLSPIHPLRPHIFCLDHYTSLLPGLPALFPTCRQTCHWSFFRIKKKLTAQNPPMASHAT